ncbi:restriction endonuclease subunit S [Enterococcus cecorum]|uniref:restriction endonuclease subunit S n=1 Tax=Enterococcus cecorum TaxID=44008 RepID=UPI00148BEFBC|nr:restriction endonuclease subunit S [Enterococcus cecorum]
MNGIERCIDDEIPFEIPESWELVRLGSIGEWKSGATPSRSMSKYYDGDIPWLKTGDLNDGYIKYTPEKISQLALEKTSVKLNPIGSVLIAMYGATIGLTFPSTTNQACCACLPVAMSNKYLFYFLMSQKDKFIKRSEGGAQPNISKEKIISTLMPLPPLAEQQRIVKLVEELQDIIKEL